MTTNQPFRWNIAKREQLGRLPGESREVPQSFIQEARRCTARIISFCDNADLVFVGRSLETIFDYLSGLLRGTSWEDRLSLLNVSMGMFHFYESIEQKEQLIGPFYEQLRSLNVDPAQIVSRSRPVAFVDIVDSGYTFDVLIELLLTWAEEEQVHLPTFRKRIRFVGLTVKTKTSPNTWRWQQHGKWALQFPTSAKKNVSVDFDKFWSAYEQHEDRVSKHNHPGRWGDEEMQKPPRDESHFRALKLALALYELGGSRAEKQAFTRQLAREPGMKHRWYRQIITELRRTR